MFKDLDRTVETIESDSIIRSTHDEILKELNEKITERIQVFKVILVRNANVNIATIVATI